MHRPLYSHTLCSSNEGEGNGRAIARENLRTEISDYSGWFGANVMDSQSRGRDIYLAMPPSGIAITPEFCSKNPYAIALRGMATCVVMAHRHPCCPRPQYSPCYHQLPSRTPLYNGLTGASETGYNKTSASGDALRASHLALWFLRSLALLLLCLLFLRLKVVETLRHSVKTVPCKSARWVNQISCLFSYYPVVPSYRAKVGVGRGIAK